MVVVDRIGRTLSFAVRLHDDFSGLDSLVDSSQVFLKENGSVALRNLSNYFLFTELSGTAFTVRVENQYYFEREVEVDTMALDSRNPVVAMTMKPKCLYPFPDASTLIRGIVVSADEGPVTGATVTLVGSTVTNASEEDGRFVLYFGPLEEDDIAVTDHHRHIKFGGGTSLQIRVDHPSYASRTVSVGTVEESATTLLTAPIVLSP